MKRVCKLSFYLFRAIDLESSQALLRNRSPTGNSASCLKSQYLRNSPAPGFHPTQLSQAVQEDTGPAVSREKEHLLGSWALSGLHPRAQVAKNSSQHVWKSGL